MPKLEKTPLSACREPEENSWGTQCKYEPILREESKIECPYFKKGEKGVPECGYFNRE